MISKRKVTVEYTITLTGDEAEWLRALVQNPQGELADEDPLVYAMRQDLFDALFAGEAQSA